jgi:hypothetical protein
MDESHEGGDCLLPAQGDATEAFEFVEEALDLMALFVEAPVDGRLSGPTGIGLDLRRCAEIIGNEDAQRIGIIGSIGDDVTNATQAFQEIQRLWGVSTLPRRRVNTDRQSDGIDRSVQLGSQPATRTANRGSFSPPLWMARPLTERCCLTAAGRLRKEQGSWTYRFSGLIWARTAAAWLGWM